MPQLCFKIRCQIWPRYSHKGTNSPVVLDDLVCRFVRTSADNPSLLAGLYRYFVRKYGGSNRSHKYALSPLTVMASSQTSSNQTKLSVQAA